MQEKKTRYMLRLQQKQEVLSFHPLRGRQTAQSAYFREDSKETGRKRESTARLESPPGKLWCYQAPKTLHNYVMQHVPAAQARLLRPLCSCSTELPVEKQPMNCPGRMASWTECFLRPPKVVLAPNPIPSCLCIHAPQHV